MKNIKQWLLLDAILTTLVVVTILFYIYRPKENVPTPASGYTTHTTTLNVPQTIRAIDFPTFNNNLGLTIWQTILSEQKKENILISPYNISTALLMLYNGASGTTYQEIQKAFGLHGIDVGLLNVEAFTSQNTITQNNPNIQINIANSIWCNPAIHIHPSYTKCLTKFYNANVHRIDFSNPSYQETIQTWLTNTTKQSISSTFPKTIIDSQTMVMLNTLYFKGNWANKFEPLETLMGEFHTLHGETKSCSMMTQTQLFPYLQEDKFQAIAIPYHNKQIYCYIFLPSKNSSIEEFSSKLNLTTLREKLLRFQEQHVTISIPKFKLTDENNLKPILQTCGIQEAFTPQANLSPISKSLHINDIFHQTTLELNEDGNETATLPNTIVSHKFSPEMYEFFVHRPFVCMIYDQTHQTILLMGQVVDLSSPN